MSKRSLVGAAIGIAVLALSAWWMFGGGTGPGRGELTLNWRGAQNGEARLPASVSWCPATRVATLEAISADTGLILTFFEVDSIRAEVHPVVSPSARDRAPRPGAIAALRWVQDSTAILGYRSSSGLILVEEVGSAVSGSFDFRMLHAVSSDTLVVRGEFAKLTVTATSARCP